jgi:ComF family protein
VGSGARFAAALIDLLAPRCCAACDFPLHSASPFCAACEPLLELTAPAQRPPEVAAAAFIYGGPIADAIVRLKYAGRSDLAGGLGRLLAEAARPYAGWVDSVVPLPLHPTRLRERGYNQSALLAAEVARAIGAPLDLRSLQRVRPTRDQAGLPRAERAENLRGAFAARPGRLARVLLVDDVRTTGATLAAGAEALQRAGAGEIRTLALARAEG